MVSLSSSKRGKLMGPPGVLMCDKLTKDLTYALSCVLVVTGWCYGELRMLRTWSREVLRCLEWKDAQELRSWNWSRGTEVPQKLRSAGS